MKQEIVRVGSLAYFGAEQTKEGTEEPERNIDYSDAEVKPDKCSEII